MKAPGEGLAYLEVERRDGEGKHLVVLLTGQATGGTQEPEERKPDYV